MLSERKQLVTLKSGSFSAKLLWRISYHLDVLRTTRGVHPLHLSIREDRQRSFSPIMAELGKYEQVITPFYKGSCACGRISYGSFSQPEDSCCCHCVTCRKLSGAPYIPFVSATSKEVMFLDTRSASRYEGLPRDSIGGIEIVRFSKFADRAFCLSCHSQLAMRYHNSRGRIGLCLGTVDEGSVLNQGVNDAMKPKEHIFVSQKVSWYDPRKGGIPCYDRFSGNFEQDLKVWAAREDDVLSQTMAEASSDTISAV